MNNSIQVIKFGGTSLATPQQRKKAALKVISSKEQNLYPVVVVSAIGRQGAHYATDTLLDLINGVDPNVTPDEREVDLLAACGEIISATVFSQTLKALGYPAQTFRGGQSGIRTDGVHGNARIVGINPVSIISSIQEGYIPVICGFQGLCVKGDGTPGGELTTLGRGGSDTTAAALGAALKAKSVEIYSNINGVKKANPNVIESAPTLDEMSYDEIAELAHLGAKILHPRAAEIAMQYQIPLNIKNTFTQEKGTSVTAESNNIDREITGVAHTGQLKYFHLDLSEIKSSHKTKLQENIFRLLAHYGLNLYMIELSSSGIGFAVPKKQYPLIEEVFNGLVMPLNGDQLNTYLFQVGNEASQKVLTQSKLLSSQGEYTKITLEPTENCTMVSVVAKKYLRQSGIYLKLLAALDEAKIEVLQTSDSHSSISFLVPESEANKSVQVIYELLFTNE